MQHHATGLHSLLAAALAIVAAGCGDASGPAEPPDRPPVSPAEAVATITQADVRYWIEALAHDSMAGRFTPSPELDKAADAIATRFREAGLRPAFGDSFIQRWPARFRYGVPTAFAPNVGGVVEGSDPALKAEYLVFVAHVDHIGRVSDGLRCRAVEADSLCNGADDNASGTAGVIELAEAFAALNPGPRRSLLFLVVSGEEGGLLGSKYFVDHPSAPLERVVGVINLDMIGRNSTVSVFVVGMALSTMGDRAGVVGAAHPEEAMELRPYPWESVGSDHTSFSSRGIPYLFFYDGNNPEWHKANDTVDLLDIGENTRVARMAFWVGHDIANQNARPEWKAGSTPRGTARERRP